MRSSTSPGPYLPHRRTWVLHFTSSVFKAWRCITSQASLAAGNVLLQTPILAERVKLSRDGWDRVAKPAMLPESGGLCPCAPGSDAFGNEPSDFSPNMAKEKFSLILLVCSGQGLT